MQIYFDDNASVFLQHCGEELEKNEAEHNLILGLTTRAAEGGFPDIKLIRLYDQQNKFVMAAVQTPPHNLLLSCHDRLDGLPYLVDAMQDQGMKFPGVLSRMALAGEFAELWSERIGCSYKSVMRSQVYKLETVVSPKPCSGFMRMADMDDLPLLSGWLEEFAVEALSTEDRRVSEEMQSYTDKMRQYIEDGKMGVWCLDDETPVSMGASTRETRNAACITAVYTPICYRGNGYASALVAKLSAYHLQNGKKFCCLYTDASNPTSNHIYQALGYSYIAEHTNFMFQ